MKRSQSNSVAEVAMDQMRAQVERLVRANERLLSLMERTKLEETPGNSVYQEDDSVSAIRPKSVAAGRTVSSRKDGITATQSFHSGFEETQNFIYQEDDNASTIRPENVTNVRTVSRQDKIVATHQFHFEFEDTLYKSRVYSRTVKVTTTSSFLSLHTFGSNWTQLTGLSLSQISDISVVFLPICRADLSLSYRWFDFGTPASSANSFLAGDGYRDQLHPNMRPQGSTEGRGGTSVPVSGSYTFSLDQSEDNDAETIRPNASRTNPESAIPQMILFSGYLQYSLGANSKISPQIGFTMIGEVGAGAGDILQLSGEDWYGKEFRRSYGNSAVNLQIMDTNDANDPFQAYRESTFRKSELFLYVFRADGDLKTSFTFLEMARHVAMIKRAKEELIYLRPISFPSCTIIIFHNQNALPGAEEYAEQIRQWAKYEECDFVTGDIHDPAVVNELFLRLVKPYKAYTEEIKKQREEEWEKKLEQQRRRQEQWEKRVEEQRKKGSIWVRKLFRVDH
jgi:hypothetical protein